MLSLERIYARKIVSWILFLTLINSIHNANANIWNQEEDTNENLEIEPEIQLNPIIITKDNFNEIINEPTLGTFIMYQAPWCGHCKRMLSTWNELAQRHNSQKKFQIGKIDCTDETEFCSDNDILGYPTFIFYKKGDQLGQRYDGHRDYESMELFMYNQINLENIEVKKSEEVVKKETFKEETKVPVNSLTDKNFDQFISEGFHFVKFFAPWCGHCQMMAQAWNDLGVKYIDTSVRISEVDCTKYGSICHSNDIRGYPTLIFFHNGKKIESYNRERTVDAFSSFIDNIISRLDLTEKPKIVERDAQVESEQPIMIKQDEAVVVHIPGQVMELNSLNFFIALKKRGYLFVKFFTPWLNTEGNIWHEMAQHFKDQTFVKIAEVDCSNNVQLCMNNNISGYPTLVFYKNGNKELDYIGSRDLESLVNYVNNFIEHDEL